MKHAALVTAVALSFALSACRHQHEGRSGGGTDPSAARRRGSDKAVASSLYANADRQILVRLRSQTETPHELGVLLNRLHGEVGGQVVAQFPHVNNWQVVRLPKGMSADQGAEAYKKAFQGAFRRYRAAGRPNADVGILVELDAPIVIPAPIAPTPGVEPAEPAQPAASPNDPMYPRQTRYQVIKAPQAWDVGTGNSSIVVAVIDTGVNYRHEDLRDNMWTNQPEANGRPGVDDDGNGVADDIHGFDSFFDDADPMDDDGHGSHCAGIIGAVGNNGIGVVGVNWDVSIMAVKLLGPARNSTLSLQIGAYDYVIMMKQRGVNIRVASNSWSNDPRTEYRQSQKDAIDNAAAAGIISVFAAGNYYNDNDASPTYPATYDSEGLISVAASTHEDQKASFSNWGRTTVDLAAPGVSILSTYLNPTYNTIGGTSMACPHVAGAAALLLGRNDTLTVAQVKQKIMQSVDPLPQWTNLVASGGRLNLARTLEGVSPGPGPGPGPVPGPGPTPTPTGPGKIVFVSDRDGNREIYSMNPDGTGQTRLTQNDSADYAPAWSPNGSAIVFVSERDGNPEVYVMNPDGSEQRRLSNSEGKDDQPDWGPAPATQPTQAWPGVARRQQ